MLYMAFKAINDIVGLNSLVPTLLIFSTYPHIITNSLSLVFQQQRANTITKVMSKLHKLNVQQRIQKVFSIQNGPDTI